MVRRRNDNQMCKDEIIIERVKFAEPDEKDFQLWGLWPRKFITKQEFEDIFPSKKIGD
jgi:hypothetical protein